MFMHVRTVLKGHKIKTKQLKTIWFFVTNDIKTNNDNYNYVQRSGCGAGAVHRREGIHRRIQG